MTVSSQVTRADYNGNGVTTLFSVPFYFVDPTHLTVLSTVIATGISTVLTLATNYTVSGTGVSTGGSITMVSGAPAGTVRITILRNVPYLQNTHYVPNDPFPASSHEAALDLLTMEAQQINEILSRTVTFPSSDPTGIGATIPNAISRAGKVFTFDSTGAPSVTDNAVDITAVAANAANINAVAADLTNINLVVSNATNINAVAADTANINTVAADTANINAVAGNAVNINAVNANSANINIVAANNTNVTNVGTDIANINAVAGDLTNINAVATDTTNINTVGTNIAAVNTNATNITAIQNASANATTATTQAGIATTQAGIATTQATAAASSATSASGSATTATTQAGIATTQAGIATTQATNSASSATSSAANLATFKDAFYGGLASDPTLRPDSTAMQAGDLYYNTSSKALKVYNGTTWGLAGVVFNPVAQTFSGNGSTTAFTLSQAPGVAAALIIDIGGVGQTPTNDFTISGTTLNFTTAPPAGTNNISVVNFGVAGTIGVPANASITNAMLQAGIVKSSNMANGGSELGLRNRIINGNMQIWQRGTSFSGSGASTYYADRWSSVQYAGSTSTITQVSNAGLTGSTYVLQAQRPNASTNTATINLGQSIETQNCLDLAGNNVVFSFQARAGSGFSATSNILISQIVYGTGTDQNVFTGYTGSVAVSQNNTLTTSWQQFTQIATIPSNATEVAVILYYTPTGTAGAYDFYQLGQAQLEKGSSATSFDYRPYGTELSLAQRYYYRNVATNANAGLGVFGAFGASNVLTGQVQYPVPMRSAPTASQSGCSNSNGATASAITSITTSYYGNSTATVQFVSGASFSAGQGGYVYGPTTISYVDFSAEL